MTAANLKLDHDFSSFEHGRVKDLKTKLNRGPAVQLSEAEKERRIAEAAFQLGSSKGNLPIHQKTAYLKHEKSTIPIIFRKLYPDMTPQEYKHCTRDPKFLG